MPDIMFIHLTRRNSLRRYISELIFRSYQELAADTVTIVTRLCQFPGLYIEQSNIKPLLKKVGAADLSEAVSNYQELLDHPATRALALMD